jgi:TolB protein
MEINNMSIDSGLLSLLKFAARVLSLFSLAGLLWGCTILNRQDAGVLYNPSESILFAGGPGLADNINIMSVNPDGSELSCLSCSLNLGIKESPRWAPDGMAYVYSNFSSLIGGIDVQRIDGTSLTVLSATADIFKDPSWSSNGEEIAFEYYKYLGRDHPIDERYSPPEICIVPYRENVAISMMHCLTQDGPNEDPDWSPHGDKILFAHGVKDSEDLSVNHDIYVMNTDGRNVVNLTQTPDIDEYGPRWSPDEKQIAFIRGKDIWVMNADGSQKRNLISGPENGWDPSWSPDGKKIAFVTTRTSRSQGALCQGGCIGYSELYVMNVDGSNPVNLTNNPNSWVGKPDWGPRKSVANIRFPSLNIIIVTLVIVPVIGIAWVILRQKNGLKKIQPKLSHPLVAPKRKAGVNPPP